MGTIPFYQTFENEIYFEQNIHFGAVYDRVEPSTVRYYIVIVSKLQLIYSYLYNICCGCVTCVREEKFIFSYVLSVE